MSSIELNVETSEHSDFNERALSPNGIDNSTHSENLDCDVNHDNDGDDVVDLEEENCSELVPVLEMLNRYCSKVKEEATISSKATERIKEVTALQTKIQVSNILRNYGIDFNILAPFIKDFQVHNGIIRLRGALLAIVADTPASNMLAGFKESVGGAKRKCRNCMGGFEDIQSKFDENDFQLRDDELHDYHLGQLEANEGLHTHLSKEYGVNKRSVLLEAPYFSVTDHLPRDIMHVILEGALSRTLFYAIEHL